MKEEIYLKEIEYFFNNFVVNQEEKCLKKIIFVM